MSPVRSRFRELGFELVYLKENQPKRPPMEEEKRDDGERYPINIFSSNPSCERRTK
jgi:hypothetical protein